MSVLSQVNDYVFVLRVSILPLSTIFLFRQTVFFVFHFIYISLSIMSLHVFRNLIFNSNKLTTYLFCSPHEDQLYI